MVASKAHTSDLIVYSKQQTAELLDFNQLVAGLAVTAVEYEQSKILSPERMVVPIGDGGVFLSMPAVANDIAIHKLVSVIPQNTTRGLPTIHGLVTVCEALTGLPLFILDGPEVTGRRTAAVSLLAMRQLKAKPPEEILLVGNGTQAHYHVLAIHACYPNAKIWVRGLSYCTVAKFCQTLSAIHPAIDVCPDQIPSRVDTVITLTTSTSVLYNEPGTVDRLVIGVGAFRPDMVEIGPQTLATSCLFTDDISGAKHEAGDFLQAKVDWARVRSLSSLLQEGPKSNGPFVFKSVGTGAWDLAAARVALGSLQHAK